MEKVKFRLQFSANAPNICNMRNNLFLFVILFSLFLIFGGQKAAAIEMEFNLGFAYDHPIDKPLPELTDGYGYNFGGCLWFKEKYGVGFGAINTRHELSDNSQPNQTYQVDAQRDFVYIEGRYKFYQSKNWEFAGILGYCFMNNIKGGDSSGSYIQYRDSAGYNSEQIGYTGAGGWVGVSAYKAIHSFHRGYFVFAAIRYSIANYSKRQYYFREEIFNQLYNVEVDADRKAKSLSINLGIIFRFDLSNF